MIGTRAVPETSASLVRRGDILHLVGDSTKLRRATDWAPAITLEQTLQELVDAQAD
jgi:nucleoside-diphosphate-sugar epimerase